MDDVPGSLEEEGTSFSPLWSPCGSQGLWPCGQVSPVCQWGFSGKPTALCLSLQRNNPTLTVPLTPASLAGAKPIAFPKCHCGCHESRPLSVVAPESVSYRTFKSAPGSPFTLTRSLFQ